MCPCPWVISLWDSQRDGNVECISMPWRHFLHLKLSIKELSLQVSTKLSSSDIECRNCRFAVQLGRQLDSCTGNPHLVASKLRKITSRRFTVTWIQTREADSTLMCNLTSIINHIVWVYKTVLRPSDLHNGIDALVRWYLYIEPRSSIIVVIWERWISSDGSRKPHCGETKLKPVSTKQSEHVSIRWRHLALIVHKHYKRWNVSREGVD